MKKKNKAKLIAIAVAACCLPGAPALAAGPPTKEEALVAAEVEKMFEVSSVATKVESKALEKVTDAEIYDVEVTFKGPTGSSFSTVRMMKGVDGIISLEKPSTNQDCPNLKKMISKDFTLKTEEDAKTLEAALDVLYPISDGFGGKDLKVKAIKREEGRVVFVRGKFFKNLKAFIFEIDESGAISKVTHSLQYPAE